MAIVKIFGWFGLSPRFGEATPACKTPVSISSTSQFSWLEVVERAADVGAPTPPRLDVPPELPVYRERGHPGCCSTGKIPVFSGPICR